MMGMRRVGLPQGNSNRMTLYGTRASFEEQWFARYSVDRDHPDRRIDLAETLASRSIPRAAVSEAERRETPEGLREDYFAGVSSVHPVQRLPREFAGLRNGHQGSHQSWSVTSWRPSARGNGRQQRLAGGALLRPRDRGPVLPGGAGGLLEIPDFGDPPSV